MFFITNVLHEQSSCIVAHFITNVLHEHVKVTKETIKLAQAYLRATVGIANKQSSNQGNQPQGTTVCH
jgi:hypothetical protein